MSSIVLFVCLNFRLKNAINFQICDQFSKMRSIFQNAINFQKCDQSSGQNPGNQISNSSAEHQRLMANIGQRSIRSELGVPINL
jgi:hypothetical protein